MYDIIIIGAGASGASFALKIVNQAKTLLIDSNKDYNFPAGTKIFPEHNRPFIKEINWEDKEVFPKVHLTARYIGTKEEVILHSNEFGGPFGNICYSENFIKILLHKFEEAGGTLKLGEKITKVNKKNNYIEILNNKGESYSAKLLVLATGSRGFELQKSMGFDIPDSYAGILSHLIGSEEKINDNLDFDYTYHLNPKISKHGPFFLSKGIDRIYTGILGSPTETLEQVKDRFLRIIKNYKKIQPHVQGLKIDTLQMGYLSKHPIKSFSKDRMLVLGEAAGLMTAFFYEGFLGALASAEIAANTVKSIIERESDFNSKTLKSYDKDLYITLENFFRNGSGCEYIFLKTGSNGELVFNTYIKVLKKIKKARQYIYEAYCNQDISTYRLKEDKWVGEQILKSLPTLSKILLAPYFFRAMLS